MKSTKKELRNLIKEKISSLNSIEKIKLSSEAHCQLLEFLQTRRCKNILIYYSLPDEIDTQVFLQNNLGDFNFYLPKMNMKNNEISIHPLLDLKTSIAMGRFNIYEPTTPEEINLEILDCVIIPARAIDIEGNRLGRGKGYYDRFLSKITNNKTSLACLLYHCQFIPEVPAENFDIPIEYCITNKGVFHLRRKL